MASSCQQKAAACIPCGQTTALVVADIEMTLNWPQSSTTQIYGSHRAVSASFFVVSGTDVAFSNDAVNLWLQYQQLNPSMAHEQNGWCYW